ncbi:laccase-2-like [Diprion similis]|uniref:laccase-2-like n=1 Tax=Diprion similis TaxID=362088 RepID=UPI001EF84730|nr:laccase-2-like [Diprion similis]
MAPLSRGIIIALLAISAAQIVKKTGRSLADQYRYCSGPCDPASEPKKCRYQFSVSELPKLNSVCYASHGNKTIRPDCPEGFFGNGVLGINGMSPGPQIEICLGDTLEVILKNELGTTEMSLHWHGIAQKGSAHMDGVSMVTQCPVLPFSSFRYEMKPDRAGSYLYYAQSAPQQGDGIYGALIVREPGSDPNAEKTLLISTRLEAPLTQLWPEVSAPMDLLVNGQSDGYRISVDRNRRYLMRLINANAIACPVVLSIADHKLLVVAVDGGKVDSRTLASHVVLFPGERFDLTLETNQASGRYLVKVQGMGECRDLFHAASLDYEGSSKSSTITGSGVRLSKDDIVSLEKGHKCYRVSRGILCSLDTKGIADNSIQNHPGETVYVSFDVNTLGDITDEMTDFKYNIYGFSHYPTYLSLSTTEARIPQINGMTFKYPPSPILSQPENTPDDILCSFEAKSEFCENTPRFCECLQIFEVPVNKTVELVVIDEGFGGNASQTFHVHGYQLSVVGTDSFEKPVTKAEVKALDLSQGLPRNLLNPPKKDTFTVPNKGYAIVRFRTDNLGYWLWEARSTGTSPTTSSPGMQFLMQVGSRENMPTVPIDFPSCGNNKKPDMIFEIN